MPKRAINRGAAGRAPAKRAPAARKKASAKKAPRGVPPVRLVTTAGDIDLPWPAPGTRELGLLQRDAIEWTHLVRNRARWIGTERSALEQDRRARDLLTRLGVGEVERRQLAESGTIRVSVPWLDEELGWEARIMPWEYIISAATRDLRTSSVIVSRWLVRQAAKHPAPAFDRVLFVESAPGRLAQDWSFDLERRLVREFSKATEFEPLVSPSRAELEAAVQRFEPDVVHLAGFDTHQGLALVNESSSDERFGDGYLMSKKGGVDPVPASELASTICAAATKPTLVVCNIWNSGARIAPLLVAAGAYSVIGFQDQIDDALAETFIGNFYRTLAAEQDVEVAFEEAWGSLKAQPKPLRGSGIVLWHGGSLEPTTTGATRTTTGRVRPQHPLSPEDVDARRARELVSVSVEPFKQFSYGLLHNDRPLFSQFFVRSYAEQPIVGLQVRVELHTNEGSYPYRESFSIERTSLDVAPHARIALTSALARTLDEVLRTSLYVEVTWGQHQIYSRTYPVTMAPVDQWMDTDADRIFLPSFVFPRDRAVRSIIKNAEQFMTALRDDPAAGFDGYQALDPDLPNPALPVDHQVQALWYSVVYKVPASYTNPPPTYTAAAQRIRTPSEIVGGGFGTCIDLALMMASSLEAIEIYPVLFILDDHAFPGYWRTDVARDAFLLNVAAAPAQQETPATAARGQGPSARRPPGAPWCFDKTALPEIRKAIRRNELVPLESVGIAQRWSFGDAIDASKEYFAPSEADRFLIMLDVRKARDLGVTPLPLGERPGDRPVDRNA